MPEVVKYTGIECIRPDCEWGGKGRGMAGEYLVVERIIGRSYTEAGSSNVKVFFWLVKWAKSVISFLSH